MSNIPGIRLTYSPTQETPNYNVVSSRAFLRAVSGHANSGKVPVWGGSSWSLVTISNQELVNDETSAYSKFTDVFIDSSGDPVMVDYTNLSSRSYDIEQTDGVYYRDDNHQAYIGTMYNDDGWFSDTVENRECFNAHNRASRSVAKDVSIDPAWESTSSSYQDPQSSGDPFRWLDGIGDATVNVSVETQINATSPQPTHTVVGNTQLFVNGSDAGSGSVVKDSASSSSYVRPKNTLVNGSYSVVGFNTIGHRFKTTAASTTLRVKDNAVHSEPAVEYSGSVTL